MTIDGSTLTHLANLSALSLREEEHGRLLAEMNTILAYVKRVQLLDIAEPIDPATNEHRRPDDPEASTSTSLFAVAPDVKNGLFCTPLAQIRYESTEPGDMS